MQKLTTFPMFDGQAEEAMSFYTSLFEKLMIVNITRYGPVESIAHDRENIREE